MEKIMLISGCSHAAGHEIDGKEDSQYNRDNSFGNLLAKKLGYRPINLATGANTNPGICRNVLEWCGKFYDPKKIKLFVLTAWTEPTRMEMPWHRPSWYSRTNEFADWFPKEDSSYIRINAGHEPTDREEKEPVLLYQEFMAINDTYLQILSANIILQTEYYLKLNNIDYLMSNSSFMFGDAKQLDFYKQTFDQTRYLNMLDNAKSFYLYYAEQGYQNPKAQYFHHDEEPHRLYAETLYNFIKQGNLISS